MHWHAFPFLRFSFALISGILLGLFYPDLGIYKEIILALSSGYLLLLIFLPKKSFFSLNWLYGLTGFLLIAIFGFNRVVNFNQYNWDSHFMKLDSIELYEAEVYGRVTKKEKYTSALVEVRKVKTKNGWHDVIGRCKLYYYGEETIVHGDVILIKSSPIELTDPKNPNEFDYRKFMGNNNIFHQDFVRQDQLILVRRLDNYTAISLTLGLSEFFSSTIEKYIKNSSESGIVKALMLGIKDDLDINTKQDYANAGAMHVLAVSGLHVGIIYLLINSVFGFLKKQKFGRPIFVFIGITILWIYALVTGLSPSVLRAATMFSFIIIADNTQRQSNIYNTLAASAFIMLIFNPLLITNVGFQLSYLAVFGIVYLQPRIYRLLDIEFTLLDSLWKLTAVSLAAQIATFPLGIYYFHQFPTYFWISNLIVIPAAFLILNLGIGLLIFSFWHPLALAIGWILEKVVWILNNVVGFISGLPFSTFQNLYATPLETWGIYLIIIALATLLYFKKPIYLWLTIIVFVTYNGLVITRYYEKSSQSKLVVYHTKGHSAIDYFKGFEVKSLIDRDIPDQMVKYHLTPNRIANQVSFSSRDEANTLNVVVVHDFKLISLDKSILFVDHPIDKYISTKPITVDIVIVAKNSVNSLKKLTQLVSFDQLILDGSNQYKTIRSLKIEAEKLNLPFYSTYDQGAITLDFYRK